jgi:hypothetical protein
MSFQVRLAQEAERFKDPAENLPPGPQKELYLQRVRQAETAAHIEDWAFLARSSASHSAE